MYKFSDKQISFSDFGQPVGMKMSAENRWVKKAELIPWSEIELQYAKLFLNRNGNVAKPLRLALGACIIQAEYGFSDAEVALQIQEGHYLQFFCGFAEYRDEAPFDSSLMVYFRKRLTPEILGEINELIIQKARGEESDDANDDSSDANKGTLLVDATCAPSEIRYPTDTSLLDEARENSETIIDLLHDSSAGKKPRTYRRRAHKEYNQFVRNRKLGTSKITVSGSDNNFEHGEYSVSSSGKRKIRDIWLQMMGVEGEHKIYSSKEGKKQAFTWRSILHMFFVKQDFVSRTGPLLLRPSNFYSDTASKWALLFMMTGKDADMGETPEGKDIRRAKKAAVISYIKDTVNRLSLRESELLEIPIGDALDLQNETNRIVDEVGDTQNQINESLYNSKKMMGEIYTLNGKLTECETISDQFSALRSQYRSDIGRLTFILEGEKGKVDMPLNTQCPFCDSKLMEHETMSYVEAARAELNHIRAHLMDLEKAEKDLVVESDTIKAQISTLEEEKENVKDFINSTLKPHIINLKHKLENYRRAVEISHEISVIKHEETLLKAELFKKESEGDGLTLSYDYRQYYEQEMISNFEGILMKILKEAHYEGYSSARFSIETFDLEIGGRNKSVSNGGGYCGLLNTIVALALQEYLFGHGIYAPGILAIDSPVSQLSESEHKKTSETMKASLFQYLLKNHGSGQIIIVEQKEKMPDFKYSEYDNVKYIEFSKNKESGRYGFLNDVFDEK